MRRFFCILLLVAYILSDSAYAGTLWMPKEKGLKVYILVCTGSDYVQAKKYMSRFQWLEVDLEEADYILVLFKSDGTSPLKEYYGNYTQLLAKEITKESAVKGRYYHVYLYTLDKKSRTIRQYFHDYMFASAFIKHNEGTI